MLNMATGVLTARALHPAGRGELAAMTLWPLFLANATALGTPSSLIFHLRKVQERAGELIASAVTLVTLMGIVAATVGAVILPRWLSNYPAEVISYARLFLLAAPLWAIQITGQAALEALELFSLSNLVQALIPITTLTGLLVLLGLGRLNPISAAACYAVAIVPTTMCILFILWRKRAQHVLQVSASAWRLLLGYGVRSAPLDVLGTLNLYIDQVLVIGLLPAASMGSYAVVLSLSRALLMFQSALVMVLFPKAAGKSTEEILAMVGRAARVGTLITGFAAVFAGLLGPVLLRALYGVQYLAAVPALRLLVAEVVVQGVVVLISQAFMAAGRPGIVSILQGIGLGLAVPLMFLFIPRFGVAGAALALLCSTLVRFLLVFMAVPIVLKQRLPRILPGLTDVGVLRDLVLRR